MHLGFLFFAKRELQSALKNDNAPIDFGFFFVNVDLIH